MTSRSLLESSLISVLKPGRTFAATSAGVSSLGAFVVLGLRITIVTITPAAVTTSGTSTRRRRRAFWLKVWLVRYNGSEGAGPDSHRASNPRFSAGPPRPGRAPGLDRE